MATAPVKDLDHPDRVEKHRSLAAIAHSDVIDALVKEFRPKSTDH